MYVSIFFFHCANVTTFYYSGSIGENTSKNIKRKKNARRLLSPKKKVFKIFYTSWLVSGVGYIYLADMYTESKKNTHEEWLKRKYRTT